MSRISQQRWLFVWAVVVALISATSTTLCAESIILWPDECRFSTENSANLAPPNRPPPSTPQSKGAVLWVQAEMADGEQASITVVNLRTKERWRQVAQSHEMLITWWLRDLPSGHYRISYRLPEIYEVPDEDVVTLEPAQKLEVFLKFDERTKPLL